MTPIYDRLVLERREVEHYQNIADELAKGRCPYSGLDGVECKSWLCDCFEFTAAWGRSQK